MTIRERFPSFSHFARVHAPGDRIGLVLRGCFLVQLGAALLFYVVSTLHWPMIQDSAVMHYVIFLMRHGLRPYSEITDNNMPGAYLLERGAMTMFGGGDLGWRVYDFFLLGVLMVAMVAIALPYDWMAGVFAGGLFALQHGTEGMWFAAEREEEMTVMIAAACACLFVAVRAKRPWMAMGFGLLAGFAATIKPTLAPFGVLVLLSLWVVLNKRGLRPWAYLFWGASGLVIAAAASGLFLVHYGAWNAFRFVLRTVTPVYLGLNDQGRRYLVVHAVPHSLLPLIALGALALAMRRRWNWERSVLLLATLFGLASYFLQRKGFPYHRYMFESFALLLIGIEVLPLAAEARWAQLLRLVGYAATLYAMAYVLPRDARALQVLPASAPLEAAMQADLTQLGGSRLQGQVQCFDMILGCLNSLYHLDLMENTGFTGDMLLFSRRSNAATRYYQEVFLQSQAQHPASVLVVTNEDFGEQNSFDRLARWPAFASYVAENYTLGVTRSFPREGKLLTEPSPPREAALAYRIYLRKGQDFPALRQAAGADAQ